MPNWLVAPTQNGLLSHTKYIYLCFLVFYLKIMSLSSLRIMEMSPITEYSEVGGFFLQNLQIRNLMLNELRQSIV